MCSVQATNGRSHCIPNQLVRRCRARLGSMHSTDGELGRQAFAFKQANLRIARIMARQHGVVARWQLNEARLSDDAIGYRVRIRALERVYQGVFKYPGAMLCQEGRWMAALLACGTGSVLSHRSAAQVWGLDRPGKLIDVARLSGSHGGPSGVRMHRPRKLPPVDLTRRGPLRLTALPRTLVDLAGLKQKRLLEDAFSASRRLNIFDAQACMACIARAPGRPGVARLVELIDRYEPLEIPSTSELQDRVFNLCMTAGLPRPEPEVPMGDRRVDFLWCRQRVILEVDGRWSHSDRFDEDRDRDFDHLADDYVTVRVTYLMIRDDPQRVISRLRRVLALRTPPVPASPSSAPHS